MKTDAEVFGGGGMLSDAEVFGDKPMVDSFSTKLKHVGQDVRTRFGDVLQLPAAVGDMILGAPANLVGRVKGAGAAVNEFLQGGSRAEMEAADAQARNLGMLESFKTPFQSAVKSLTGAEHYDQEIVAEALDKVAKAVATKAGGVLTAHGVEMLLGTTLDALGIKGISPTVKAARARAIESQAKRELARRPPPEGQMSDADVFTEPKSELGGEKLQKQFVKEIDQGLKELTPSVREIFKRAKSPEAAVENLFAQAAREGKAARDAKGARVPGDEAAPDSITAALDKEPTARTPDEQMQLELWRKVGMKQGGFSDKNFALGILAATGLTAGAMKYIEQNEPEIHEQIKRKVRGWMGLSPTERELEEKNIKDWEKLNDPKLGPNDTVGLALAPEDLLGPLGVGMAVKGKGGMWHPEAVSRLSSPLKDKLVLGSRAGEASNDATRNALHDMGLRTDQISTLSTEQLLTLEKKTQEHYLKTPEGQADFQADRMIRSYLNKHAGTEGDPLAGYIEVPVLKAERKTAENKIKDAAALKPPTLERKLDENGSVEPIEKSQMRLRTKQERFQERQEEAKELAERIKQIDAALKKQKDGVAYDAASEVEVPYEAETRKWGDLIDEVIEAKQVEGPRGPETEFNLKTTKYTDSILQRTLTALRNYMSHAGDFARQNIPPEKLAQYDFPRLIKETAANDARVTKEMEKAAADSTAQLPVYKDYGDGMKWVELKLPEKLTEEQAKGVRSVEEAKVDIVRPSNDHDYVAVDKSGKAIQNSYTQEPATGRTPEEAWLAGQMALEGNCLGHCVGGYVDSVASGESKIYSLRDAKGKSHVTVEVEPPAEWSNVEPNKRIPAANENKPPSILQIKGAQNRAPVAKYLPYVQDFVRGGKWEEVGDLENTGLVKSDRARYLAAEKLYDELPRNEYGAFSDGLLAKHDLVKGQLDALSRKQEYWSATDIEKLSKDATQAHEDTLSPLRKNVQRGSADPKLLAGIAAAGGLAAYFAQNPEDADALAAAGILAATGKSLKSGAATFAKGLDYAFGALSTRLGEISPALRKRARDYERVVMERTDKALDRVSPFLHAVREVGGEAGKELKTAMLTGDATQIAEAIKGKPELVKGWREVQNLLREFEKEHIGLGRFKEGLTNYFPRIITDFEGLKKALGQQERTKLEETLARAEAKIVKEQQRGLTDIEQSLIINRSLTADPAFSQLPDYAKARKIREVTEKLEPFYAPPTDSLLRYISAAVQDAEMAKFFGRNLATKKSGEKVYTDVDASIGNIVAEELKAKRMDHTQANELRAILKSRFEGGEQAMSGPLQDVRNLTNAGLLGNVLSAATQIGDSVMTIYHHGLMPTLRAVKDKLTGNAEVTTKQFGLVNHIAEELGSARATGKVLQTLFKYSGFTAIDQFAKGLNLNAALTKNRSAANSVKGLEKLQEKYGQAFGDEFPALIDDLKAERMTERVKSLLFSELSDAQPITKMEMPQAYLDNPNGRILYQMKTYMLKQMDVIRRDAYDNIADGKYVEGAKNLVAVAAALSLSNIPGDIIKNWIKGRPVDLDKIDYVENLLRTFGLNRYTTDKMTSGTPAKGAVEFGINTVKPPILSMAQDLDDPKKLSKYVPIIGRTIYDRELGGNEAAFAAEQRRERLQQRALRESENPSLRDARRAREEARRRRKMEKIRRMLP